jgi:hypothetical protein
MIWDDFKKHNDGKLSKFNEAGTKLLCKSELKLLILNYGFNGNVQLKITA